MSLGHDLLSSSLSLSPPRLFIFLLSDPRRDDELAFRETTNVFLLRYANRYATRYATNDFPAIRTYDRLFTL